MPEIFNSIKIIPDLPETGGFRLSIFAKKPPGCYFNATLSNGSFRVCNQASEIENNRRCILEMFR
jgi:hypothetical protein